MKIKRSFIEFAKQLHKVAVIVADDLEHKTDHYVFIGSMNDVEELKELLSRARMEKSLSDVFYGEAVDD